jgi:hypothetical protein
MLDVKLPKKDGPCPKEVEEREPNLESALDVEKRDTKKGVLKKPWVVKDVKEEEKVDF